MDLGTNNLALLLADSPDEAPKYRAPEFRAANLTTAQIVGRGTQQGNPTVDLIFVDERGQKYVAMITGGLIENLAGAVLGMKQRTAGQTAKGH